MDNQNTRRKITIITQLLLLLSLLGAAENVLSSETKSAMDQSIAGWIKPLTDLLSGNPWVQGSLVILITFTISSILTWILFKTVQRITSRTTILIDDQIVKLLRPPVYYSLVVIGITAGLSLMPLSDTIQVIARRCFRSLNILIWVVFFIRFSTLVLTRLADLTDRFSFIQRRTLTLFDNLAKVVIFGGGIYGIFMIWKIDMTAWLASAGIAGIAIGFAAKDTLSNLFSGVFILADAPYKVGDYVVLDKAGRGKVTHIGLRSTRILTRDDIEVTVPNSIIGNSTIINQSGGPHEKMRIRLKIGVAYGSDIDKVTEILTNAATEESAVCKSPKPRVRFRVFGASSLDFELLFWVDSPEDRGRVVDIMNTKIYKQFGEEGIEIPYAKQDVYIKGLPESWSASTDQQS